MPSELWLAPPLTCRCRLYSSSVFKDNVVVSIATGLVSVTSRTSMTVLVIGGVVSY